MTPPPPMAIPFIVGYAAASAAGLIVGTLAFTVVSSIVSFAVSALMKSATASDAPPMAGAATSQPGAARTTQFTQPTPPHEVVVGRIKKSGPVMFTHSDADDDGRAQGYFYIQIVLAAHHCKAIGDVYIGDDLSTAAQFTDVLSIGKHLGTPTQMEDATFLADLGAGVFGDHWLRGRAHIAVRHKVTRAVFESGVPNHAAILWGADEIYDPRTLTSGWTNNAILVVAWWMIWGEGYTLADFDLPQFVAAANVCDERVRVLGVTTTVTASAATDALTLAAGARSLDVGDGVRVSSSVSLPGGLTASTTYYVHPFDDGTIKLCATVADAFAGTGVDITSAGSGTLTLTYWDEARYKCNGAFNLESDKREIRDQLLTACGGHAYESGGLWFLHAAAAAVPTVTLDEDDLRDGMVTIPKRSLADRINTARAVFVNPDTGWQPGDAPPRSIAAYLTEDQDEELAVTLRPLFTISGRCIQRLQKIAILENRLQRTVKFPAKLTAMRLRPLDGVYLSIERYTWDQEQHRVMGWSLASDGGIDLLLQEDSADVYAWDYLTDEVLASDAQGVTLPDPSAIDAPATITVDTPLTPVYSRVEAAISEVLSVWADGYDVEFRSTTLATWSGTERSATPLVSIVMSEAIDIRARAAARNGAASNWATNLAPGIPTSLSVTGGTNLQWTNGSGAAQVQVFQGSAAFEDSTLFATETVGASPQTLAVDNDFNYWLRSVNADGNVSNTTAHLVVGTPSGVASDPAGGVADAGDGGGGGDE